MDRSSSDGYRINFGTVHFLTIGVAFTAIGLSLLWVAPSSYVVCLLLAIGGIGVASFHPQATAYAGALATEGRGMGTSIFLTGGNIGRALGPLVLMFIPYRFGLEFLAWEMIPGIFVALLVPKVLKFEEHLDLTAATRGNAKRGTQITRTVLERCLSAHAATHRAIRYCGNPNCYANRFRKLFICPT